MQKCMLPLVLDFLCEIDFLTFFPHTLGLLQLIIITISFGNNFLIFFYDDQFGTKYKVCAFKFGEDTEISKLNDINVKLFLFITEINIYEKMCTAFFIVILCFRVKKRYFCVKMGYTDHI